MSAEFWCNICDRGAEGCNHPLPSAVEDSESHDSQASGPPRMNGRTAIASGNVPDLTSPVRIQLSRRKGWRKPENTVVVARPSKWGNPYAVTKINDHEYAVVFLSREYGELPIGAHATYLAALEPVISAYRGLVEDGILGPLDELRGKNLACWCPPDQPCHADVLLEIANGEADGTR